MRCVASVRASGYSNWRLLVVDNGSDQHCVDSLRRELAADELLCLTVNHGYAEGNNIGLRQLLATTVDAVLILNNDTVVDASMMSRLVGELQSDPEVGMVGPAVWCLDAPDLLFAAGSFVRWSQAELEHRGMFRSADMVAIPETPQHVDFLVGCGIMVTRRCLETIGLLDSAYYLNYEDVEWGVRARRHGFAVALVPQAVMWHKVSATLGLASAANTYYMTRNGLRFFARETPWLWRPVAVARILLRTLRTIGAWSLRRRYSTTDYRRKRDANLLALRDAVLRRWGPMGADVTRVCYGQ